MTLKPICNKQQVAMKSRLALVWAIMLLAPAGKPFAQADNVPILPAQYAEAVLDVQGMI